jgi:TRAP-type transport system periplasmic protein
MFVNRVQPSHVGVRRTVVAAAALALAGCAINASPGGNDKAGGSVDPVVLTLASTTASLPHQVYHPAVQYFVDRVKELSRGALRIDIAQGYGAFSADAEQQVVRDVSAGKIELGWVGTHVFDTVGVTAFQALTAPMLIDSYPLQQAVLDSDIPGEMLGALDEIGVEGIAVVADGLRKPVAVSRPLLVPADYQGITFQAFRSRDHAEAIKALGATPVEVFGDSLNAGLLSGDIDGYEKGLRVFQLNENAYLAPYVTANVNLWPHTLAFIANPRTMSTLTAEQRGWLTRAGADASSRSTDLTDDDAELVVDLCASGARFANASDTDLAALRRAFAPVYGSLDDDPTTRDFIDRIDKLKQSIDPGPALEIPSGCTGQAPVSPPGATGTTVATTAVPVATQVDGNATANLSGIYRWTITKDDALTHGTPSDKTPEVLATFPTTFTVTLTDKTWSMTWRGGGVVKEEGGGSYTVNGDQVMFNWDASVLTFSFTVDADGTMHLTSQPSMLPGDQFIWATKPWEKVG